MNEYEWMNEYESMKHANVRTTMTDWDFEVESKEGNPSFVSIQCGYE